MINGDILLHYDIDAEDEVYVLREIIIPHNSLICYLAHNNPTFKMMFYR